MDDIVWYIVAILFIACVVGNVVGVGYLIKIKWDDFWKGVFNKDKQL